MIIDKIKALFQFIEFLHSNTENFKQFDNVVSELYLLQKERKQLSPQKNFADKLKYDEVQAEIKQKINVINENIIQVIQTKAIELNICDLNKIETLWNWNISEIRNLKKNFGKEDIPEILIHESKYLEFRTKTNCTYFQDFFFNDLDEMLKELFDFFKTSTENEFEAFETKTIQVNNIREAVEQFQKGNNKLSLPIDFLTPSKVQQNNSEPLPPQQHQGKEHLLTIPTNASPDQILNFWFKLQGNDETDQPYWESETEIEHFVYQNFEGFPGVTEIKEFNPNMNKSELYHVTWAFFKTYGKSKTKKQYENLLLQNFTKFKDGKNVYSNIKDQTNEHLKKLLK